MYLVHEQLAKERARSMHEEAQRSARASRLVIARRWQRRAERANMRARLARAAVV
jgi:cob(I)alamin adenosyltransferase